MTVSRVLAYQPQTILPSSVANWRDRVITELDSIEHRFNIEMPNWTLQTKYDHLVHLIEEKMAPINAWIDDNGNGSIPDRLATGLGKLPLRVARNIITTLFQLIHAILDILVHPVQSFVHLAKFLVDLINSLSHPQTWAEIGAGITGAALGQAWVLATPVGLITTLIGTALVVAGISAAAILAAYHAEVGDRLESAAAAALSGLSKIPESFATGLLTGVILGAIRKAILEKQQADLKQQQIDYERQKAQLEKLRVDLKNNKALLFKQERDFRILLEKLENDFKILSDKQSVPFEKLKADVESQKALLDKQKGDLELQRGYLNKLKADLEHQKALEEKHFSEERRLSSLTHR